jgi:hypothetical protein
MKRHDAVYEVTLGTVNVLDREVGPVDPAGDAVDMARRRSGHYHPGARSFDYEPVERDGHWEVLVKAIVPGSGRTALEAMPDLSDYEDMVELDSREVDVASVLARRHSVAELRDLRKKWGASFHRGSTKAEMAEQLVEQAPDRAFELAAPR